MRHRIYRHASTEMIAASLACVPEPILDRIGPVRFVVGCDPVFIGLHPYRVAKDGRSYRLTAHYCSEWQLADGGPPTIVLPVDVRPDVVTHELGHALDFATDWQLPWPEPVSAYATRNRLEAVAEAFAAWLHPEIYPWAAPILHDSPILAALEGLRGGSDGHRAP